MQKTFLYIIIAFSVCCSTIPGPIDNIYLSETGKEEKAKLESIEKRIIDCNVEKNRSSENLRRIRSKNQQLEKEYKQLEKEIREQNERLDSAKKEKNNSEVATIENTILKNRERLENKQKQIRLGSLEKGYSEADYNLKSSELAQYVAELGYEKSKIAIVYRDRHEPDPKKSESPGFFERYVLCKDPDDRYGYKQYKEFYNEKLKDTESAKKEFTQAENLYLAEQKKQSEK